MFLILYPLWASYWCLRKPLKADLLHWLIWWVTYEVTNIVRWVIWWVPFFNIFVNVVLMMLYFPIFTNYFRKNVIFVTVKGINTSIMKFTSIKSIDLYKIQKKIQEMPTYFYLLEMYSTHK